MKLTKLQSVWIIGLSTFYTAQICSASIFKHLTSGTNRAWVDRRITKWSNRLLDLVSVNCKVINPYGVEPQAGKATIIMCNHSSLYDIPLSFQIFPQCSIRMLAKKELSKIPILGKGMTAAEFPFIDRKNRHQAFKDLLRARELMESGIIMWIAPEGTRSKDGQLAAFKKGAFITAIEAKATIIPVGIVGANNILPARTLQLHKNQLAEIHVAQPIDAADYSMATRDELVARVYETIKALVNSPLAS